MPERERAKKIEEKTPSPTWWKGGGEVRSETLGGGNSVSRPSCGIVETKIFVSP